MGRLITIGTPGYCEDQNKICLEPVQKSIQSNWSAQNDKDLAEKKLSLVNLALSERGTGVEPVFQAWEARVEPIN
jgi:hypothetical protein